MLTAQERDFTCERKLDGGWVVASVSPTFGQHELGGTGGSLRVVPIQMSVDEQRSLVLALLHDAERAFLAGDAPGGLALLRDAQEHMRLGTDEKISGVRLEASLSPGPTAPFCGASTASHCPHARKPHASILATCVLKGSSGRAASLP